MNGSKGKKRGKNQETDGNQPKDLELLTMDSDDDRQHFDYKDIVEHETNVFPVTSSII